MMALLYSHQPTNLETVHSFLSYKHDKLFNFGVYINVKVFLGREFFLPLTPLAETIYDQEKRLRTFLKWKTPLRLQGN